MKSTRRQFLRIVGAGAITTAGAATGASAQQTPVVEMGNNYFDPIGLYVEPGTTVRFEITAGAHSATAYADRIPSDARPFDSGTISEGSYEYTFEKSGTYDYYCIPHKSLGMVGRIVVGQPGGPAEETPIPDGNVPESETIVQRGSIPYGADEDSGAYSNGGMMGPGMMSGGRGGRPFGLPLVGGALGALGVAGAALYWALKRTGVNGEADDSAMSLLRSRYARGDIDDEEYQRRRRRLENDRNT
ncbi:plastocyanin/azurin family copper-binding protein [Haloferax sp. YSMS24]|uniref:plastocyanin/azurin family copper-binding protein n=1 Tax=Haloferax sp. YSMS24 TaxID=3388425 RepID=UPI00398C85B9